MKFNTVAVCARGTLLSWHCISHRQRCGAYSSAGPKPRGTDRHRSVPFGDVARRETACMPILQRRQRERERERKENDAVCGYGRIAESFCLAVQRLPNCCRGTENESRLLNRDSLYRRRSRVRRSQASAALISSPRRYCQKISHEFATIKGYIMTS